MPMSTLTQRFRRLAPYFVHARRGFAVAIVGLFVLRSLASFTAQYALAWTANQGVLKLRTEMFEHLLTAQPTLFTRHSASNLTNTLVYEVQSGAQQIVV